MDIKTIALTLLILRLIAVYFMSLVLKRQLGLLRDNYSPELRGTRIILFVLAMVIFVGNFVPILIDTLTIFGSVARSQPLTIGITYAYSNALTAAVAGITFWLLYRSIEREQLELAKRIVATKLTSDNKQTALKKANKILRDKNIALNGNDGA